MPDPEPPEYPDAHRTDTDPAESVLLAERAHLDSSRAHLALMRERTAGLDHNTAADWVSQMHLSATLSTRMRQLGDDPAIPLFFGRL